MTTDSSNGNNDFALRHGKFETLNIQNGNVK